MSIAGQANINIGLPNESANSDSLYTAFNKIQNNFTTLFSNASQVTAGNGISIDTSNTTANISVNLSAGNNITIANVNSAIKINAIVDRYSSNSTSNISLGLGSKTLIIGTGLSYTTGQAVIVAFDNNNLMNGTVSSYNPNTGVFVFNASNVTGSTGQFYQEWQINLEGIVEGGVGIYGVIPGQGILIDGSNVSGKYSGNANISLANSTVIPGTYKNPNITIDQFGRIVSASNNLVSGTVTSVGLVSGGIGLSIAGSPITSNGAITITNTGVTRLIAGAGVTLSANTGEITIAASTSGFVTNVAVTSNALTITGSPITSSGIITVDLPTNLTITGNITANNRFIGNGTGLTNIPSGNLTGVDGNTSNILYGNGVFADAGSAVGATGPTGATGPIGATGITGPTGPSGFGATGATGDRYSTTSSSSLSVGTGSKTLTVQTGLAYSIGQSIILANSVSQTMSGTITSYASGNGNMQVSVTSFTGSGTYTSWTVNLAGAAGSPGATGETGPTGATGPVAGSNTNVIFNDASSANGSNAFTFNKSTNTVAISNALTVTGNVTLSNSIIFTGNTSTDIAGVTDGANALSRNISIYAGNLTTATVSNTIPGNLNFNSGNSLSVDAGTAWIARGGTMVISAGTGNTANGNAIGGTSFIFGGSAITALGTANGGPVTINAGQATTSNGIANAGVLTITGGIATSSVDVSIAGNINITGGFANATSANATSGTINIRSGNARTNTSGNAITGDINLQIGNSNGVTSNVSGNINIGSQAANSLIGVPTAINIGQTNTPTIIGGNANISANLNVTNDITANNITSNIIVKTTAVAFSSLPIAAAGLAGARAFITDGNLAMTGNFGATVSGGGSNSVPVVCDGTNWVIG